MNNVKRVLKKLGTKAKDFFVSLKEKKAKLTAQLMVSFISALAFAAPAFAEGGGGDIDPEATFNNVIGFFATWLGRAGLVVALIGGIMFGFAIKNDDADSKQRGITTMISEIVVFAVTKSLELFGLTGGSL